MHTPEMLLRKPVVTGGGNDKAPAMAGTFAVMLAIIGSRWGAYLGRPPVFLTDVLIVAAVSRWVALWVLSRGVHPVRAPLASLYLLPITCLTGARFLCGGTYGLDALRDFAPYAYSAVGLLSAVAAANAGPKTLAKTGRCLLWALRVHALWFVTVSLVWPGLPLHLPVVSPEQGLHLLQPRNDFDMALTGVYAAWVVLQRVKGKGSAGLGIAILTLCWAAIFRAGSRAGLIGASVPTLLVVGTMLRSARIGRGRRLVLVLSILMATPVFGVALAQSPIGQRILGTFGETDTAVSAQANGTSRARTRAWNRLWDFASQSPTRILIGVGYGPNYMRTTGADLLLVGEQDADAIPRSPHNYWIGTLMRGGFISAICSLLLAIFIVRRSVALSRLWEQEPFFFASAMIPMALLIPASLGVVLESPFGAVPYFWCAGVLTATTLRPRAISRPKPSNMTHPSSAVRKTVSV